MDLMKETGIEWNQMWKTQMMRHKESNFNMDCASSWDSNGAGERYWKEVQTTQKARIEMTLRGMDLSPDSGVLDIGAGPGVLSIPISKKAAHVTAVEPSSSMMQYLKYKMTEQNTHNITCIEKRWDDVDIEKDLKAPYNVVLSSLSLGMYDIEASLKKMIAAACGYVYIYWFAGEPSWETHSKTLWPVLHGKEYQPMPKSDLLFNILYQMGIYPQVDVFKYTHPVRFNTLDEAVHYFISRYQSDYKNQKKVLTEYLREILLKDSGQYFLDFPATCTKIWWKVQ